MIAKDLKSLPDTAPCRLCHQTKPLAEMVLIHRRRTADYLLRPRCKPCHNEQQRTSRREWKRSYQRRWRARNQTLNRSYWDNDTAREQSRLRALKYYQQHRDAKLIQHRLRTHGRRVTIAQARELLARFGRLYPKRAGLTARGLRECERIRSRLRHTGTSLTAFEIRLIVYEDGWHIRPDRQPKPSARPARNLHRPRP